MKTIIVSLFLGCILFIAPIRQSPEIPVKVAYKTIKHKKEIYKEPTGKVLRLAIEVSQKTTVPLRIISKIMWAESRYNSKAVHINKNGTHDSGLFQINSAHIVEAKKMGIDIYTDEGNAEFAVYLINSQGLKPWKSSSKSWNTT